MRAKQTEHGTKIWLSESDTYDWAHQSDSSWPGSDLSSKRVFAEFDAKGDLIDCAIDGKQAEDIDVNEFNACISDHLSRRFGPNHPAIRN